MNSDLHINPVMIYENDAEVVIVVTSDQHLGYSNSNANDFSEFLGNISKRTDVTDFVILGDFIDMWRRDISGLFLENHEILQQVLDLKSKMNVYCVAGNHDFHLLKLANHNYPLFFTKDLTLQGNGIKYVFKHGWEFDLEQQEPIMELLCYNISDEDGQIRSDLWNAIIRTIDNKILGHLEDLFKFHGGQDKYISHIQLPPNQRLQTNLSDVEKRACESVKEGEILVFGHTHKPFVNSTSTVVNSGSWVKDAEITNTYVELDGTNIHLKQFGHGEIFEREECPMS